MKNHYIQCQAYGNYWGHCTAASNAYSFYLSCLNKQTTCPPSFIFDGANCYSGIIIPSGYNPFIWGNGFYTQQNVVYLLQTIAVLLVLVMEEQTAIIGAFISQMNTNHSYGAILFMWFPNANKKHLQKNIDR